MLKSCFFAAFIAACVGYGEVIENAFLRVTADPQNGRIDVVDKRNGQHWQQPATAALQSTPPLTLADLSSQTKDVASAGNRIDITPAMTADAKKIDGPADCSATLHLGRTGDTLLLSLSVTDDVLMPPEADRRDWWERDSVEFWLGSTQYAIRAVTGRVEIVNTNGTAMGIFAEVKRLKDGYHVAAPCPSHSPSNCDQGRSDHTLRPGHQRLRRPSGRRASSTNPRTCPFATRHFPAAAPGTGARKRHDRKNRTDASIPEFRHAAR